jgi:hypothetical protein
MDGRMPRTDLLEELMPAPAANAAAERPHPLPPGPSRCVVVRIRIADRAGIQKMFGGARVSGSDSGECG